ncbi:MAG: nucleotidyltransferase [Bacteroidia bacterium]|nr:nucleotidyltransferase [Bacteroidia bacterium]
MKPTLVILAAGIGSRYGGIKQIDPFGPNGETIMDYSLFDAIRAGFGKIVFIIRPELEPDFKEVFDAKLQGRIPYEFAYQTLDISPFGLETPAERTKPWGTGHAMLAARKQIDTPFAVINADDFYGRDAFVTMAAFLSAQNPDSLHAMAGYELARTLSENGSVSRGVCEVDGEGYLQNITERTKIYRKDGQIVSEEKDGSLLPLPEDSPVSMNFWGFQISVFERLDAWFREFAAANIRDPKAEFYIPLAVKKLMDEGHRIRIIPNSAQWFGVTYREDKEGVQQSLAALTASGEYPAKLW